MVGGPCPMHKHFHTVIGLMDAQDPLLCCVHHGRNHVSQLLRKLTLNPSILSRCFGEVGRRIDALRFVNGKPLPLGLPSSSVHSVNRSEVTSQFSLVVSFARRDGLFHLYWLSVTHVSPKFNGQIQGRSYQSLQQYDYTTPVSTGMLYKLTLSRGGLGSWSACTVLAPIIKRDTDSSDSTVPRMRGAD